MQKNEVEIYSRNSNCVSRLRCNSKMGNVGMTSLEMNGADNMMGTQKLCVFSLFLFFQLMKGMRTGTRLRYSTYWSPKMSTSVRSS